MLENIEILLDCTNIDLYNLFFNLSNEDNYSKLLFIKEISINLDNGLSFSDAYTSALVNSKKNYLDSYDLDLLKGFFSILGKSDLDGQISNCRLYKSFFNRRLKVLESKIDEKCKSTYAISLGCGIMISIIVL